MQHHKCKSASTTTLNCAFYFLFMLKLNIKSISVQKLLLYSTKIHILVLTTISSITTIHSEIVEYYNKIFLRNNYSLKNYKYRKLS